MRDELLRNPVFAMAATQFDGVADFLGLDDALRERCKWPKRLITVTVPIRHDDGRTKVFFGYRVQHHLTSGPAKGGLRYHPAVDLGEVAALAMWMTWKCGSWTCRSAAARAASPAIRARMSRGELERLTRRYTEEMIPFIGPRHRRDGPRHGHQRADHGVDHGHLLDPGRLRLVPGIVTGKPVELGGCVGRTRGHRPRRRLPRLPARSTNSASP